METLILFAAPALYYFAQIVAENFRADVAEYLESCED
jgi:hypothetical protein